MSVIHSVYSPKNIVIEEIEKKIFGENPNSGSEGAIHVRPS